MQYRQYSTKKFFLIARIWYPVQHSAALRILQYRQALLITVVWRFTSYPLVLRFTSIFSKLSKIPVYRIPISKVDFDLVVGVTNLNTGNFFRHIEVNIYFFFCGTVSKRRCFFLDQILIAPRLE
jgi:hypothetical protein